MRSLPASFRVQWGLQASTQPITRIVRRAFSNSVLDAASLLSSVPCHLVRIDIEHSPQCGGRLKIIAAIEEPSVIVRILAHRELPTRVPPRTLTRRLDLFQTA
jgi:hypothetical protein